MRTDSSTAARPTGRTLRTRLGASAVAAVSGATIGLTGAAPAPAAVDPLVVVQAATAAYEAYDDFRRFQASLEAATKRTIAAIDAAKTEILLHTFRLAAAEVRACVDSAVINVADLEAFTPDGRQVFALNATECVNRASSLIPSVPAVAQVDELGFALNAVGPIALIARASAGLDTAALRDALIRANNGLTTRLGGATSCRSRVLDGDSPPGGVHSVLLTCTAYNGESGTDTADCACRPGQPVPPSLFTVPKNMALRSTSNAVARAVLPVLTR